METTGLNEQENVILEVAAIVTDHKLNIIEEYSVPVRASQEQLAKMDEWCRTTHTQSRLLEDIQISGIDLEKAQIELQKIKRRHWPTSKPPIAGNSVHFDKRFLDKHMPNLVKELSHRIIDVSSFMGALSNYHDFKIESRGETAHRALADIKDSIFYLKGYLERFS